MNTPPLRLPAFLLRSPLRFQLRLRLRLRFPALLRSLYLQILLATAPKIKLCKPAFRPLCQLPRHPICISTLVRNCYQSREQLCLPLSIPPI